ncbi:unnamed protein product [Mortierella alpina]
MNPAAYWRIYTRYRRGGRFMVRDHLQNRLNMEYPNDPVVQQRVKDIILGVLDSGPVHPPNVYVDRIRQVLEHSAQQPAQLPAQPLRPVQISHTQLLQYLATYQHGLQHQYLSSLAPVFSGTERSPVIIPPTRGEQLLREVLDLFQRGLAREAVIKMSALWMHADNTLILDHARDVFLNTLQHPDRKQAILEMAIRSLISARVHTRVVHKLAMTVDSLYGDLPPEVGRPGTGQQQ